MSEENKKTLEVYDEFAKKYLKQTIAHDDADPDKARKKQKWIRDFCKEGFSSLPKRAKILEIGSADGKNAEMLSELGFRVTASDVADDFLKAIKKKGFDPIKFNVLSDEFPEKFDGVFFWRVFVHFTKEDVRVALSRIFENLKVQGRVIFNVMNLDSEECSESGWVDFPGEYHLDAERFFHHFYEDELVKLVQEIGFSVVEIRKNGGKNDDKWLCVVLEKPAKIKPEILEYVEEEILPQYDSGAGHGLEHIRYVIRRSLNFAEDAEEDVDRNMVYVVAAYHDIGRKIDNDTHEIHSAKILLADERMKEFFNDEERRIIAEAIEDHRASSKHLPRSVYGRIVSSADRNTSVDQVLDRIFDYTKSLHPEYSEDELMEETRIRLREKYKPDGYAAEKMFFFDPDYQGFLEEIERITRDKDEYRRIQAEFNREQGKVDKKA